MKTCAHVLSYALTSYLEPCLRELSWIDHVLVLNGTKPFYDAPKPKFKDKTEDIVNKLVSEGQHNLHLERCDWETEHQARNWGQKYFRDRGADRVFMFDADSYVSERVGKEIIRIADMHEYGAVLLYATDYWKNTGWVVAPRREAPTLVYVSTGVKFYDGGCGRGDGDWRVLDYLDFPHYGFCLAPEEMKWKSRTYWNKGLKESKTHNVRKRWFEDVWSAWNPDMTNIGMIVEKPDFFHKAIKNVAPVNERFQKLSMELNPDAHSLCNSGA